MSQHLIASLGNPSPDYDGTRHSIGRVVVEKWLAQQNSELVNIKGFSGKAFRITPTKLQATLLRPAERDFAGQASYPTSPRLRGTSKLQAIIVTPDLGTYMNESGPAIAVVANFFKISPEHIIIVHDDTDLPLGALRVSKDSAAAGHRGVESIISALGTKNFIRLRLGIESRINKSIPPTEDFVLQKFSADEQKEVNDMIRRAEGAITAIIIHGLDRATGEYNHSSLSPSRGLTEIKN